VGTGTENSTFAQAVPSNRSVPRIEDRPLILNRPFVSVGEMGYAFRDVPWRSLNFFSADSADAGLLDVFSMDAAPVAAGRVNLNTRQPAVLQALLAGSLRSELSGAALDGTNVASFVTQTTGTAPLMNRSELATRIVGNSSFPLTDNSDYIKTRREATIRALGDAGQTRTWNLMIDVIAQSGRYPITVNSTTPGALSKFIVEGECRYWVHLAIDRFTGEIVDEQWEPVYE
jgi:hypothetical protein